MEISIKIKFQLFFNNRILYLQRLKKIVLILDEATSALDTETEYHVQKNIDKLRNGKTTIIIAHRISTIHNADVIYVLDKGNVVAYGTHERLITECDVYKELYTFQQVG